MAVHSRWRRNLESIGAVSDAAARLLPSNDLTRLRFVPTDLDFHGTLSIRYRAWDQTQGVAGGVRNLSLEASRGNSTAFSSRLEVATLTVASANDAPVLGGFNTLPVPYTRNSGAAVMLASMATVSDVDSPKLTGGKLIVEVTGGAGGG